MILTDEIIGKISEVDFEKLYKEEKDSRIKERYLAMMQIKLGKMQTEVAEIIRRSRQTIDNWIERFIDSGLENLINDQPGKGRKPFLKEEDFDKARSLIEEKQKEGGHLTAHDIKELLEEAFNVKYQMKSIYDVLERLNLSWISGRSKHPKSDPVAQEEFKKTSKPKLKRLCQ